MRPKGTITATIAAALLTAALGGCGTETPGTAAGRAGAGSNDRGGSSSPAPAPKPQRVKVAQAVWYAGLKLELGTLIYEPAKESAANVPSLGGVGGALTLDVAITNLATTQGPSSVPLTLEIDNQHYEGNLTGVTGLPGSATTKGTFEFTVPTTIGDLAGGTIVVGDADGAQAVVPLGSTGERVTLEPQTLLPAPQELTVAELRYKVTACQLRADLLKEHDQLRKNERSVACLVDIQYTGNTPGGHTISNENFRLKLPDGTVQAAEEYPIKLLSAQEVERDLVLRFTIPWPASGAFAIQLLDLGHLGRNPPAPQNTGEVSLPISK
jgi:hypothetical protein